MTSLSSRLLCALLLAACASAVAAPASAPRVVYSPYEHLAMWRDASNAITAAPDGVRTPYIVDGASRFGRGALTWAFATGECGDEVWASKAPSRWRRPTSPPSPAPASTT